MKRLSLFTVTAIIALYGCSKNEPICQQIVGKWTLDSEEVEYEDGQQLYVVHNSPNINYIENSEESKLYDTSVITFEFKANSNENEKGTMVVSATNYLTEYFGPDVSNNYTYEISKSTIIVSSGRDKFEASSLIISGDKMTVKGHFCPTSTQSVKPSFVYSSQEKNHTYYFSRQHD